MKNNNSLITITNACLITLMFVVMALVFSCSSPKLTTRVEQPTIILTDSNLCVSGGLSAAINQDSLFMIFDKGFILGNGENTVKIYWQSLGTADIWNGAVAIEPHLCISGTDFCLTGQYWVQVHQTAFMATLQRGLTFGTPSASVFIRYDNGKLTVTPKVCIKTKVTAKALH